MKLTAIASIKGNKEVIGTSILDANGIKVLDLSIDQIKHLTSQGNPIRNITIEKSNIIWNQRITPKN